MKIFDDAFNQGTFSSLIEQRLKEQMKALERVQRIGAEEQRFYEQMKAGTRATYWR